MVGPAYAVVRVVGSSKPVNAASVGVIVRTTGAVSAAAETVTVAMVVSP